MRQSNVVRLMKYKRSMTSAFVQDSMYL